jgi:hypothetical protein
MRKLLGTSPVPSFGLRMSSGGTKTWTVMRGLDRRRVSLGRYPIIGLATAREQAKKLLAEITLGKNFSITITFDELVPEFLNASKLRNKLGTTTEYRRLMERHFLPVLGRHKLGDLHARHVSSIIARMSDVPSEANHALTAMKAVLNYAVQQHHIAHLKWEYINEKDRMIILPAAIVKNNREHAFPYGDMVADVIAELPHRTGYLFPASRTNGLVFNGWGKQKIILDANTCLPHWTLHDLRRTFATQLAGLGAAPHIIERLINHASGTISGVSAIYNRYSYATEMRSAIEAYEMRLQALISPSISN